MPHRVTHRRRYRISNDILMVILDKLNPVTLYRTCQAFDRVYALVKEYKHLYYKFLLATVGMKDGAASYIGRSPVIRLQVLQSYQSDWPRLIWTDEQKLRVPITATQVDVSDGFLYYIGIQSLDLVELPSCRTNRPPSQTRHLRYNTNQSDSVAIDTLQSLIVTGQAYSGPGGQISLRLKIRNLWNFDKHPKAQSAHYDCSTHIAQPTSNLAIVISGNRVIVSLEFINGLTKHLLLDWSTLQAMWLEEQDVVFLGSYFLLGVRKIHNKVSLYLYNIFDMRNVTVEREYELPPIWAKCSLRFGRNSSPSTDTYAPPNALFYSDPSARVLLLTAKKTGSTGNGMHWLFINESFFRPTSHADRRSVPWSYWSQFCLIKDFLTFSSIGIPQIVGSRVIYLEKDVSHSTRGHARSRLHTVDFSPHADILTPPTMTWTFIGRMSQLRPIETHREFPTSTTNGLAVDQIHATEDNIVVLLENHGDLKPVNVLTFGVPTPRTLRH
ncbi:hypothetical protein JR316_0007994 [Psilocybe cubensis]|uniref:Uncharacterized protein n=2 Tax=Psilocybe cubensis TaxID=181762 RepID=A0ACB8GWK7_PSICU|nr:hypothetical protein JR316_0007994 [Psilocybe cubensis]KAH9479404.1 hypothetical protein JR316_0007994 [Psilocybe cubensis]